MNLIEKVIKIFSTHYFLKGAEKNYINLNKRRWKLKNYKKSTKNVILVDFFPWSPWIHIWSYLTNILSYKHKAKIHFFYFHLIEWNTHKYKIFFRKLEKIYNSFNAEKGIFELDFRYNEIEKKKYLKIIKKFKGKKSKLISYQIDGIKIGDLIYDTYIRTTYEPTVDLKRVEFENIFVRAHKIFYEIKKYFNKFNVKAVVPSHSCYISYGLIMRYSLKKNIPVYKVNSVDRGSIDFKLIEIKKNFPFEEPPYYKYKNIFNKINEKKKRQFLNIGKKTILKRLSGKKDIHIPYIKRNPFSGKIKKINFLTNKKKIYLFPHCYIDNPHRYRKMLFPDFYEQSKYILNYSNKGYEVFYKQHPNEVDPKTQVHTDLKKMFPKINILPRVISHRSIINSNPHVVITNHGTICHEYAYFKVPVINTGDNPHINYDFSLNPKNKFELDMMICNIDQYKKKLNFDKRQIYEFMYMHYYHFKDKNKEIFKDEYFSKGNSRSHFVKYQNYEMFAQQKVTVHNNIINYVNKFLKKN